MSGTTLVIVDMQSSFPAANTDRIKKAVLHEIHLAKRRNDAVIVLEYDGNPLTHSEIMNSIATKKLKMVCETKYECDGSYEVVHLCEKYNISNKRFRVCGVNRTACVRYTVEGLADRMPSSEIQVSWSATSDYTDTIKDSTDEYAKNEYAKIVERNKNVKVRY